jgi:hypothetical protein
VKTGGKQGQADVRQEKESITMGNPKPGPWITLRQQKGGKQGGSWVGGKWGLDNHATRPSVLVVHTYRKRLQYI